MMERICSTDGVVFYQSSLLAKVGVPHTFSTRLGGVSSAPFDSLNLGNPSGGELRDSAENIRRNHSRWLDAAGMLSRRLVTVSQVHGRDIIPVTWETADQPTREADAVATSDPRCAVAVRVADCVPVLLSDDAGTVVAAVHAGWRGIVGGVLPNALSWLSGKGCTPDRLLAAIGPCIGFDAFEVGAEVLDQFRRLFGDAAPVRPLAGGKGLVDLRQAARMQIQAAGIPPHRIDVSDRCTFRDCDEFYSHRRQRGLTGRMAAAIAPRSPTASV